MVNISVSFALGYLHRASIDAACIVIMWLKCFVSKCVNQVALKLGKKQDKRA